MTSAAPIVSVLLDPDWASGSLVDDVRRGLGGQPLRLPPKWLYDDEGSRLFDQITRLPEYYPTEAERAILDLHGAEIAEACDATTVVELGSGTSDKTRILLDAFAATGRLRRFVPVDVSEATLRAAADMLDQRYPEVAIEAVVGDFTLHLGAPARRRPTPGRLPRRHHRQPLRRGARAPSSAPSATPSSPATGCCSAPTWSRAADRLIAAYNDSQGVTAAVRHSTPCAVLNRELGADFDLDAFSYVPFWDPHMERMDLRLRAEMPQRVTIPGADLEVDLASGEEIRVEISTKFRPDGIRAELDAAGFEVTQIWTDPAGDFALTLAQRLR